LVKVRAPGAKVPLAKTIETFMGEGAEGKKVRSLRETRLTYIAQETPLVRGGDIYSFPL
jgi:hypothetical protein